MTSGLYSELKLIIKQGHMKSIKKLIILLAIAGLLSNCTDPAPTPQVDETKAIIEGLSKTWNIEEIILDGTSIRDDWSGVTLSFDLDKNFITTGLSPENSLIWPPSGSYSFPDPGKPLLLRWSDGIEISINNISETSVDMTFTISGRIGGRETGLTGIYNFTFTN